MVMGELTQEAEVVVIGSGPGGYAAAFRAADLGLDVTMVDPAARPGGVCLYKGCIPSKTFLYLTELIHDAAKAETMGISFGKPRIDLAALRTWKGKVIDQMANGLVSLNNRRGIQLLKGRAEFESSDTVRVYDSEVSHIKFGHAVIATGSQPMGSRVSLVELEDRLLAGVDQDLVQPLHRRLKNIFESTNLKARVVSLEENKSGVDVTLEGDIDTPQQTFDKVLVAIGRQPSSRDIGLANTKVKLDEKGFVGVDDQQRTADERIFAVGDVIGGMMLAHKATREGKIAAEVIAGQSSAFDVRAMPAVVYTDPQIAWCGMTEEQARAANRDVKVQRFPWKFSGRAATMGAPQGLTKIIVEPQTGRILGVGITGRDTEGLISEGVLAIEMGALAEDMALSIHPHPTLSETD